MSYEGYRITPKPKSRPKSKKPKKVKGLTEVQEQQARKLFLRQFPASAIASKLGAMRNDIYDLGVRLGYITPVERGPVIMAKISDEAVEEQKSMSKKKNRETQRKARIEKQRQAQMKREQEKRADAEAKAGAMEVRLKKRLVSNRRKAKEMLIKGKSATEVSNDCGIKKADVLDMKRELGIVEIGPKITEKAKAMLAEGYARIDVAETLNIRLIDVRNIASATLVDTLDEQIEKPTASSSEPVIEEIEREHETTREIELTTGQANESEQALPTEPQTEEIAELEKTGFVQFFEEKTMPERNAQTMERPNFDLTETVRVRVNPLRIAANALMDAVEASEGDKKEQCREALIATVRGL